ncbi:MAG: hypothetical protein AB7F20_03185 [Geoalkalibacter sp.]|uniref:hypothetical protein n=1 Tax=Geoalkalibacter sp. TaxID=3041440 RepID=UPI002A9E81D3|nr:hypothetical protein [Thermodesulfobacteriota bacterium]
MKAANDSDPAPAFSQMQEELIDSPVAHRRAIEHDEENACIQQSIGNTQEILGRQGA